METLRTLREKAGYSQKVISIITKHDKTYIPQSTLSDWELGKKIPDANSLLILKDFYNCSKEDILTAWENTKKIL